MGLTNVPRPGRRPLLGGLLLGAAAAGGGVATAARAAGGGDRPGSGSGTWVGTWSTTPTGRPASDTTAFADETIRQVVRVSAGGSAVRVRLTNEFGATPLVVGEARIALRDGAEGARTAAGSDRRLTFGGRPQVTVPAGAPALSDPVALDVPAGADLVISVHLPRPTPGATLHGFAYQDTYVAAGNVTAAREVTATRTFDRWYFLSGVAVRTRAAHAGAVVALGDSITDGASTTRNANRRWPDLLAERLRQSPRTAGLGVLNQGVSGNRLLHDPTRRPGTPPRATPPTSGRVRCAASTGTSPPSPGRATWWCSSASTTWGTRARARRWTSG
jgi:hypothetical protein